MSGRNQAIMTVNAATKQAEVIELQNVVFLDWGFRFFVASELDAFKAAYQYRVSPHGVEIGFSVTEQKWMVTVFNDRAAAMGISAAR